MKKLVFLAMLFFLISFALAEDEWLYSDSATIRLQVSSTLNAHPTQTKYVFDTLKVNLSLIPKNTERQTFCVFLFTQSNNFALQNYHFVVFDGVNLERRKHHVSA